MENIFRVCINGRYYDIPTQNISQNTLENLKKLTDENHTIDPRKRLGACLEASEISNTCQTNIQTALQTLETLKNI